MDLLELASSGRRKGSVTLIGCIEDQRVIDGILANLRGREQDTPLAPPTDSWRRKAEAQNHASVLEQQRNVITQPHKANNR